MQFQPELMRAVVRQGSLPPKAVILCNTGTPRGKGSAELVEALKLVQIDVIPRIYFTAALYSQMTEAGVKIGTKRKLKDISLTLRDIYGLQNVRFSEVSARHDLMLICASYSSVTIGSPKPTPLHPGLQA